MESSPVERNPVPNSAEYSPVVPSPELTDIGAANEKERAPAEQAPVPQPPVAATPVQLPQVVPQATSVDGQAAAPSGSPAVAGDDDLIEKEWVDQAKKIISQTKDDPHAQETQVNRLQTDYLQKRYGKTLGSSE